MIESVRRVEVMRADPIATQTTSDLLAVEEPLEIRLQYEEDGSIVRRTIAVTMRTPGADIELAAGFLFTEGIIRDRSQIARIGCCGAAARPGNRIHVELAPRTPVNIAPLARNSYTSSSCGVCGKTSADALHTAPLWSLPAATPMVDADILRALPASLRAAQSMFDATGGLHASGLFDVDGRLLAVREDVGRHNALDKLIGGEVLAGRLPARTRILVVSGRVSFELVQKALMAGIPVLAAIGAPSSLAVETARQAGMTLVGFIRHDRLNIYCGAERLAPTKTQHSNGQRSSVDGARPSALPLLT
jgi:FdhD protein